MNERYKIARSTTVSGSPTVGGFAGYFKNGIKPETPLYQSYPWDYTVQESGI